MGSAATDKWNIGNWNNREWDFGGLIIHYHITILSRLSIEDVNIAIVSFGGVDDGLLVFIPRRQFTEDQCWLNDSVLKIDGCWCLKDFWGVWRNSSLRSYVPLCSEWWVSEVVWNPGKGTNYHSWTKKWLEILNWVQIAWCLQTLLGFVENHMVFPSCSIILLL